MRLLRTSFEECKENLAGRVSIGLHLFLLRPSAARMLLLKDVIDHLVDLCPLRIAPQKSQQFERTSFLMRGWCLNQPASSTSDPFRVREITLLGILLFVIWRFSK